MRTVKCSSQKERDKEYVLVSYLLDDDIKHESLHDQETLHLVGAAIAAWVQRGRIIL